jgi:hypothetical protein
VLLRGIMPDDQNMPSDANLGMIPRCTQGGATWDDEPQGIAHSSWRNAVAYSPSRIVGTI